MKMFSKLILSLLLLGIVEACEKDSTPATEGRTLDVNVSFGIRPDSGKEFIVNLYYTDQENEPFYERDPDETLKRILSEQDIENGFTLTFENFKESPFAYATAYVDMDGDEKLSEGDIAVCYYRQVLRDVIKGLASADNVAHRYFLTMEMDQLYSTLLSFEAEFTFPITPVVGTELIFSLYYADQEEARFFDRAPDAVETAILDEEDIQNGLKLSLDNLEDRLYIYATAYLDIDGNGELNHGDIAMGYNGKSLRDIFSGELTADNMAGELSAVWSMEEWFENENGPAIDVDGNVYTTVVIGDKEWMVENLKVTRYRTGAPIASGLSNAEWADTYNNGRLGAYAVYPFENVDGIESEEQMIAQYGLLYNGFAVMDPRGLAPLGWRVATDEDFMELELAIGFTEAQTNATGWRGVGSLMLRSTTGWPVNPGTDDLGFKALPAGAREQTGNYNFFNVRANFWTSTPDPTAPLTRNFRRILEDTRWNVNRGAIANREGYSVRCVRDR